VRELKHSPDDNALVSPDLSIICDEITGTGIVGMAYQEEPYSIIWMVRSDGYLVGFTSDQYNKIGAWHYHTTTGTFESCACIPGTTEDELWVVVKRGATRYIEQLQPFDFGSSIANIWFMDGSTTGLDGYSYTSELSPMDLQPGGQQRGLWKPSQCFTRQATRR
jgi:hypothetical protein